MGKSSKKSSVEVATAPVTELINNNFCDTSIAGEFKEAMCCRERVRFSFSQRRKREAMCCRECVRCSFSQWRKRRRSAIYKPWRRSSRKSHHRHRLHFRWSDSEKVADDVAFNPVLLISGMGGSILNAKKKSNSNFELRVWVWIFLANLEFKKYLWSMYNPHTGYVDPLDPDIEIEVPDDDSGWYVIDILDHS